MRVEILKYERIRDLRVEKGMSQKVLAETLNLKQNTYSQYEIGTLKYPIEVLISLAKFHNTSVDYLLGLTDVKEPYPTAKKKMI